MKFPNKRLPALRTIVYDAATTGHGVACEIDLFHQPSLYPVRSTTPSAGRADRIEQGPVALFDDMSLREGARFLAEGSHQPGRARPPGPIRERWFGGSSVLPKISAPA